MTFIFPPGAAHVRRRGYIIHFGAERIISLIGTEAEVAEAATTYLQIIAATSVAMFPSFACGTDLRGAGDRRTPLAAVIANFVDSVVAYTLIFGTFGLPALGVSGSAFGAAAGPRLGAAYMLPEMARGNEAVSLRGTRGWRPRIATGRQLFSLGVPAAVEQMFSSGTFMVLLAVVALVGTPALAAQQIALTARSTAFLFDAGMGYAWSGVVATCAQVSLLMWWLLRQRICDYERGRRDFCEPSRTLGR